VQYFGNGVTDRAWATCSGPYESAAPEDDENSPEFTDAPCYPAGDTHGTLAKGSPNRLTGCPAYVAGGDLDFDGTPYWRQWPTGPTRTATLPAPFHINSPTTGNPATIYDKFQFQTDLGFVEETTCNPGTPQGCAVPPPNAPGNFYPFWTQAGSGATCNWQFGRVLTGRTFGGDKQYGTVDPTLFPEIRSKFIPNTCG
jgi:hypothetical protein